MVLQWCVGTTILPNVNVLQVPPPQLFIDTHRHTDIDTDTHTHTHTHTDTDTQTLTQTQRGTVLTLAGWLVDWCLIALSARTGYIIAV